MAEEARQLIATIPAEETITDEHLQQLVCLLDSKDETVLSEALKLIGDLNRLEGNRKVFGDHTEAIEKVVYHLFNGSPEVLQFAARAVGNLSYQDEKNRHALVALQVPSQLVAILRTYNEPLIQRNVAGAIANVSFISDELQAQLVAEGVIELIIELLRSNTEEVVVMALRAISNVCDESTIASFRDAGIFEKIVHLCFSSDSELIRSDCITIMGVLAEGRDHELITFAETDDWLQKMHNIAKEDPSEQVRTDAWEYLVTLADNGDIKPTFEKKGILKALMDDAKPTTETNRLTGTLQLLGHLAVHDDCMDVIFASFSSFFELFQLEDENVKMFTAMIIGNIARKDIYCARLVEAGAIPILHGLCKNNTRVQHLVFGALRNIAVLPENKGAVIDEEGLIETINQCLNDSNNAHVLYNAILLLKVLANGGKQYVDKLVSHNILPEVNKLIARQLQEGQERIHYEAARLLVVIALTNEQFLEPIFENNGLVGIQKLLETNFDLLHSEAVDVIALYSKSEKYHQAIVDSGILASLVPLLRTSSKELQLKILVVVGNVSSNENALTELSNNGARELLSSLSTQLEEFRVISQKVLAMLPAQ